MTDRNATWPRLPRMPAADEMVNLDNDFDVDGDLLDIDPSDYVEEFGDMEDFEME